MIADETKKLSSGCYFLPRPETGKPLKHQCSGVKFLLKYIRGQTVTSLPRTLLMAIGMSPFTPFMLIHFQATFLF
jgi:hypothetical protein